MKEYPMSKARKVFCYIFMLVFWAGAGFLVYRAFLTTTLGTLLALVFFGIVCFFIGVYLVWEVRVMLVTLDDQVLTQRTVFGNHSISLKELDGYREGEKEFFQLVPIIGKPLQLTKSIADRKELIEWIKENYEDVDERAREQEEETLLEDERYGATREDREEALRKSRRLARMCNVAGPVIGLWGLFYPQPYELCMALAFLAPVLAVYLIWSSKGLIRFSTQKRSPYPGLDGLIWVPIFTGLLRAVIDYKLYEFSQHAWLLLGMAAALLVLLTLAVTRGVMATEKRKTPIVIGVIAVGVVYCYGLLVIVNCHFDRARPDVWPVVVTGKRISHGKSTSYYVKVSPWGKYVDGKSVDVSKSFYNAVATGDSLRVILKPGKLGVPWYYLVAN